MRAREFIQVARQFRASPSTPSAARELVAAAAANHVDGQTLADAELLVSELTTNAVVYAGGPVEVRVHVNGVLRVEVADPDPRPLPEPALPADPETIGGRGLVLVSEISDRWGYDIRGTHKTVWFELDPR